jgi:hypothetical protein
MLAPGELLTTHPPTPEATRAPAEAPRPEPGPQPPATAAKPEEPESRSFLMILLRALGAVHS